MKGRRFGFGLCYW